MLESLQIPRLVLAATEYELSFERQDGAVQTELLRGGAQSLVDHARPVGEAVLEAAIERAEDWLMPFATELRDKTLDIDDPAGRFRFGLQAVLSVTSEEWNTPEVESMFLRVVDIATGRNPSALDGRQAFVADLLLLRELAHHGGLNLLRLRSSE
jgi:hypothetical protein